MSSYTTIARNKYRQAGIRGILRDALPFVTKRFKRELSLRLGDSHVEHAGVTLDLSQPAINSRMKHEIADGTYEQHEATFITEYVNPERDVIELGGCIGFISCYLDQYRVPETAQMVVEPNPQAVAAMEYHHEQNDCGFCICIAAYAPESERVHLEIPEYGAWGTSTVRDAEAVSQVVADTIDLTTLFDEYPVSPPVTLVVDIEGGEADLLRHELDVIEKYCETVVIEFHDHKEEYVGVADDIRAARTALDASEFEKQAEERGVAVYQQSFRR